MNSLFQPKTLAAAVAVLGVCATSAAFAQTATIYGALSNFDVVNDTGEAACGFEVEIEGLSPDKVPYFFTAQRYGTPVTIATATGTRVRWGNES